MTEKLERKISNISVTKLRNIARYPALAVTRILRLDLEYFSPQSSTPRRPHLADRTSPTAPRRPHLAGRTQTFAEAP